MKRLPWYDWRIVLRRRRRKMPPAAVANYLTSPDVWYMQPGMWGDVPPMKQSRPMSLVEAVTNVAVGYGLAVGTQMMVFPFFGLDTTLADNLTIGAIFTVVSIARSYGLRRLFEAIRVRG
mgnify:CR=1 FL=1